MESLYQHAQRILYKYYWENRNTREHILELPEEKKNIIREKIFKNVPELEGFYPYFTLSNLEGIYNRVLFEDEDGVVFIVAPPGYGKSSLALVLAKYIDPTINDDRIIFNMDELKDFLTLAAKELKKEKDAQMKGQVYKSTLKGKAVILDEGVFMLFSGDAMTKEGKTVQKLFSIIRALNLMMFVNATNFRKVNKGVKEDRIIGLIRIIRKGVIEFYSKKRIRKIRIMEQNIYFGRAAYNENVGRVCKDSDYWKMYEQKKATFLLEAVE
jgi:DNA polymerase III delta prime subunit